MRLSLTRSLLVCTVMLTAQPVWAQSSDSLSRRDRLLLAEAFRLANHVQEGVARYFD